MNLSSQVLIHSWFENSASQHANKTALVTCQEKLTYQQLNEITNQLARFLIKSGIESGNLVAICFERNFWLPVAILAVLKVGATFVPLDPEYPIKRNQMILEDCDFPFILSEKKCEKNLPLTNSNVIFVDEIKTQLYQLENTNLNLSLELNQLAYVLYTSGSTGKPKGVAIEQQSCINLFEWALHEYSLSQNEGILAATSICFDLAIFEIFFPLLMGKKMMMVKNIFNLKEMPAEFLAQITLINTTPSAMSWLLDLEVMPPNVHTINLAGEVLSENLVERLYQFSSVRQVYNLYGPTEATIYATYARLPKNSRSFPTIGKPIPGVEIYIENQEIYIGGKGLARGYLNQAELTEKKFQFKSISQGSMQRYYQTHDRGYYDAEGNLCFLGRMDYQIKLSGYRIELQEIEKKLCDHPSVKQAVILALPYENSAFLKGFITLKTSERILEVDLKEYLKRILPHYMIPTSIKILDAMPLTENLKIDRIKLAELTRESDVESQLKMIWKRLLNVDQLSVHDHFFDIGGHSLLLLELHNELEKRFEIKIDIIELFKYPTISTLAKWLQLKSKNQISNHDIAIIGMACRFPGAENLEQFWTNLINEVDSISQAGNNSYNNIEYFDRNFFNFSAKEAQYLDPQQRIFLECTWEALENAGCSLDKNQNKVGVFTTISSSAYLETVIKKSYQFNSPSQTDQLLINICNDKDYLSTRVSYKLNLKGPSVNVQTACSSSLVAVHLACQSLFVGESDITLVGGVAIQNLTTDSVVENITASPDGYCRAFDQNANGTVFGSGAGVIVLKRYSRALEDRDHIYAVIKGSAINNDGFDKIGYTAPSVEGQSAVISAALQNAGIEPQDIGYIEAHGTGTPLGDPIEIAALNQAFQERCTPCPIGSVKTNIGHLDVAAGMAGLIKAVLILKNKQIPASLHFLSPNKNIPFNKGPFYVCQKLTSWENNHNLRLVGVSSFGIGGSNAHVILAEHNKANEQEKQLSGIEYVLPISAKTDMALRSLSLSYLNFLEQAQHQFRLVDICFTAAAGRSHFEKRRAIVASNFENMIKNLKQILFESAEIVFSNQIAEDYVKGSEINWGDFYKEFFCCKIPLPTYPFQRQRYWLDLPKHPQSAFSILGTNLPLPFSNQIRFTNTFSFENPPYVKDHGLFGKIVVPGSSHLAVFLAAANQIFPSSNCSFEDILFLNPMILEVGEKRSVQTIVEMEMQNNIQWVSCNAENWVVHIRAQIKKTVILSEKIMNIQEIQYRCPEFLSGIDFYNQEWAPGHETGNSFRWINQVWFKPGDEAIALVKSPLNLTSIVESIHPGLIESGFQLLTACWDLDNRFLKIQDFIYVPFSIEKITFFNLPITSTIWSYAKMNKNNSSIKADILLINDQGKIILDIQGFEVKKLYQHVIENPKNLNKNVNFFNKDNHTDIFKKLTQANPSAIKEILCDYLTNLLINILGDDSASISFDYQRGLMDYGLDSLMIIELRNRLQADFNIRLSTTFAYDFPTLHEITTYILNSLQLGKLNLDSAIDEEFNELNQLLLGS